MICPHCNTNNIPEDAKFCPNCGAELNKPIFSARIYPVRKDERVGFVNENGNLVTPYIYDWYDTSHADSVGIILVDRDDKCGWIDLKGRAVVPCIYDYIDVVGELAAVKSEDGYGILNLKGALVEPFVYEEIMTCRDGFVVKKDGLYGFINAKGEKCIPLEYYYLSECSEGVCVASNGEHQEYIGLDGKVAVHYPLQIFTSENINKAYEDIKSYYLGDFHYGLASVPVEWPRRGYINRKGEMVIPPIYTYTGDFLESGVANAYLYDGDEKLGPHVVINRFGDLVAQLPMNDQIYILKRYEDGIFHLEGDEDMRNYFCDKKGKIVYKTDDYEVEWGNGLILYKGIDGYGCLDYNGNIVITPNYEEISGLNHSRFLVVNKGGKWGLIDKKGRLVLPIIYDSVVIDNDVVVSCKDGDITIQDIDDICLQY